MSEESSYHPPTINSPKIKIFSKRPQEGSTSTSYQFDLNQLVKLDLFAFSEMDKSLENLAKDISSIQTNVPHYSHLGKKMLLCSKSDFPFENGYPEEPINVLVNETDETIEMKKIDNTKNVSFEISFIPYDKPIQKNLVLYLTDLFSRSRFDAFELQEGKLKVFIDESNFDYDTKNRLENFKKTSEKLRISPTFVFWNFSANQTQSDHLVFGFGGYP